MIPTAGRFSILAVLLTVALVTMSSCNWSKSSYPTSPGGTAKELNSGDFGNGATYQHTFSTAGTYAYHCVHHAAMTGTVQVTEARPTWS